MAEVRESGPGALCRSRERGLQPDLVHNLIISRLTRRLPSGALLRLALMLELALGIGAIAGAAGFSGAIFRAVAGLALVLAVPFAAGSGPVACWFRLRRRVPTATDFLTFSLPAGLVLLLVVAASFEAIGRFSPGVVAGAAGVSLALALTTARIKPPELPRGSALETGTAVGVALAMSLAAAIIFRWWSPFPLHPSWDIFAHATVIDPMLAGRFAIDPQGLSESFTTFAYPTGFHLLHAASLYLVSGNVDDFIGMSWVAPIVFIPIFGLALTGLGVRLGMPPIVAGLAAGAATFFFPWHRAVAPTALAPAVLAGAAVLWGLAATRRETSAALLLAGFMLHPWVGLMGGVVAAILMVPRGFNPAWSRAILAVLALPLVVFALNPQLLPDTSLDFNPLTPANWPEVNTIPLSKYRELVNRSITSPLLVTATIAGLAGMIFVKRPVGTPYAVLTLVLWLYFLPIAGVERLEMFLPYLVVASALLPGYQLVQVAARRLGAESVAQYIPPLVLAILITFVQCRQGYLNDFLDRQRFTGDNGGVATSFSQAERDAARALSSLAGGEAWLLSPGEPNFSAALHRLFPPAGGDTSAPTAPGPQILREKSVLVSDPDTQNTLGALTGLRTLGGGPFAPDEVQSRVRSILINPAGDSLASELRALVTEFYGEAPQKVILVYSGRTERWINGESRVYQPWRIADRERADALKRRSGMDALVDNENLLALVER